VNLPAGAVAHSRSGQFIVRGNPQAPPLPPSLQRSVVTNWARLEPTLLSVSCERVKEALLAELGVPDRWRGRIYLNLHPVRAVDEMIVVNSSRFADGWVYSIDLPDALEPARFVRSLVGVMLVEWGNRSARESSAEVPAWLTEGLTEELLSDAMRDLVLRPPNERWNALTVRRAVRQGRQGHPLAQAHAFFGRNQPLGLDQLNWPQPEQFSGEGILAYRYSAQLFVHELLRLRNGRAFLTGMLDTLGQHLNWQTAFFRAFAPHFQRQLDLEKWWDLQTVHFTDHDLSPIWSSAESLRKLAEVLRVPVPVRAGAGVAPAPADVALQTLILEGDDARQRGLLQFKIHQLQSLRARVAAEIAPLAADYQSALEFYLRRKEKGKSSAAAVRMNRLESSRLTRDIVSQLNRLDARLASLLARPAAPAPSRTAAPNAGVPNASAGPRR
jgi:hypothetical protein